MRRHLVRRSLVVGLGALLGVAAGARADGFAWVMPPEDQGPTEYRRVERRVIRLGEGGPAVVFVARGEEGEPGLRLPGRRGFLGVHVVELTPELRRHLGGSPESGVLVSRVVAGSPAYRAGVQVGDVLARVDGRPIRTSWDLKRLIAPRQSGEELLLELYRDGKRQRLTASLAEREARVLDLGDFLMRSDDGLLTVALPRFRLGPSLETRGAPEAPAPLLGELSEGQIEDALERALEALGDQGLPAVLERERGERALLESKLRELELRRLEIERRLKENR